MIQVEIYLQKHFAILAIVSFNNTVMSGLTWKFTKLFHISKLILFLDLK